VSAPDVLIYADTVRSPELRHEIPVGIVDPFPYAEAGGRAYTVASALDVDEVRAARPDAEVLAPEDLGIDELLASGMSRADAELELVVRICERIGLTRATVPAAFPLGAAERLRAVGVELEVDDALFKQRRRAKTDAEIAGVLRAQGAADDAMRAAARMLREAEPGDDGVLVLDGEPLTAERIKMAIDVEYARHGVMTDAILVAVGAQGAVGHDMGSGPVPAGVPVVVDLWPQDRVSGCFTDMTRTFVAGAEPPEDVARWHALARDALARVVDALKPGVSGRELWELACEVFEAAGEKTQRTKAPGEVLRDGFFHALGHGVCLEPHEAPMLGRGTDVVMAGDVIAIEPGTYRYGYGGVRLEDVVRVTDDGCEVLTDFPYDLQP